MSTTVSFKITSQQKVLEGSGELTETTRQEALIRCFAAWAIVWVVMVPTIFIPGVHFVSVPALLIAGPIVGRMIFKLYSGKKNLKIEEAKCPNCDEKLFLPSALENWPANQVCMACKKSYSAVLDLT